MSTLRKIFAQSIDGIKTAINYVNKGTADKLITGWTPYADAAASRPVDGTGGSPTVTWTRTTSSPLMGDASFLFTKDAANRQGEGVSYDYTIQNKDLARVQEISFDYEIASGTYSGGTPTTDSDLIVYMYRTTATGRLIEPSVIKLDGGVSGVKYSYRGEFQTDFDATGYRFIIHVATTSASAYTVKFDNFQISPSKNVSGSIVTPWQDYPSTPTLGGYSVQPTIDYLKWRRVGDILEATLRVSGGTLSGTDWTLPLPGGLVATNTTLRPMGFGHSESGTAARKELNVFTNSTSAFFVSAQSDWSGGTLVGTALAGGSNRIGIFGRTPIVGWGATATLGQDADTTVIASRAKTTNTTSFSASTLIDYASIDFDRSGSITTGTWKYTARVAGVYSVSGQFATDATTAVTVVQMNVHRNNSGTKSFSLASTSKDGAGSERVRGSGHSLIELNAGDTIDFRMTSDTSRSLSGNSDDNYVSIQRISGPSQIAASEIIRARYTSSTSSGTNNTVVVNPTREYDSHLAYNTSTGIFTCPAPGEYTINAGALGGNHAAAATDAFSLTLQKNSVDHATFARLQWQASVSLRTEAWGSCRVQCNAGDQLRVRMQNTFGATVTLTGNALTNFIEINKTGGVG